MWVGNQRAAWERTAALMSWIAVKWTGEAVEPAGLNPFWGGGRDRVAPEVSAEAKRVKDRIRKQATRGLLKRALGG